MQIPFKLPQVGPTNMETSMAFAELSDSLHAASSIAGTIVSLEKELIETGYQEIMQHWIPPVAEAFGYSEPRLSNGFAILLYFTNQVHIAKSVHGINLKTII